VVIIIIGFTGWLQKRIRYIRFCEKLPGPGLNYYGSSWLCHVKPLAATLNTVPGIPGIPRSIEVFHDIFFEEFGKMGIFRLWFYHPYRIPFARCRVLLSDPYLIRQCLTDPSVTKCLIKEVPTHRSSRWKLLSSVAGWSDVETPMQVSGSWLPSRLSRVHQ